MYGMQILFNGDFYFIRSYVNGGSMPEPDGIEIFFAPDVSNEVLGEAVKRLLMLSNREFPHAEWLVGATERMQKWIDETMIKFGYKKDHFLFDNMISVGVGFDPASSAFASPTVEFQPTNHEAKRSWRAMTTMNLPINYCPFDSTDAEFGRAIRTGFQNCLNPFGLRRKYPPHDFSRFLN
jgi:CDI immunity protein